MPDNMFTAPDNLRKVVLCKDCTYYAMWADLRPMNYCNKHDCTVYDDDFCSRSEPRTQEAPNA